MKAGPLRRVIGSEQTPVQVRVLYMQGCAATPLTVALVHEVAAALPVPISLEQVQIDTDDQAVALRFLGSPSVQVNGQDIEREARGCQDFGLT